MTTTRSLAGRGAVLGTLTLSTLLALSVASLDASAASKDVTRKCRGDYNRLCPGYKVGSDQLRACMRSQHRAIGNSCMNALVDAGEAPASARRR